MDTRRGNTRKHKVALGFYPKNNSHARPTNNSQTRRNVTNYRSEVKNLLKNKYVTTPQKLWFQTKLRIYKNTNDNLKTYIKQLKASICENEQNALKDAEVERLEGLRTVKYGEKYEKNITREQISYQPSEYDYCRDIKTNA
jgi:hypothetical protein